MFQHSPQTKMLLGYFLLIFFSQTPTNVEGIDILEQLLAPIIDFKEGLFNGMYLLSLPTHNNYESKNIFILENT